LRFCGWAVGPFGPLGGFAVGRLGHLARWAVGSFGRLAHLGGWARWAVGPVGRLGHLAHVGGWLIWADVRFAYFGGRSRLGGSKAKAVLTPKEGPKTQQHNMDHAPPQVTCTINRSHTCKRTLAHQSHCPHDPTFMANHTPDANKLYSCTEKP